MELVDKLIDTIEQRVTLNAPITSGILPKAPKAVCFRLIPSNLREAHLDDGRVYQLSFQILVKDSDQVAAMTTIENITNTLDHLTTADITLTDGQFVKCEVYTLPNFVEKTEHDEYIYTALFNAEYAKEV
ncbi:minor capsid protein [Geobacillus icigianus]|uniref:Minor capsid protein n=1 Tax=Geobacillus subterraneus TaxID=129338 RepID=A0A679FU15_9BACL|nr:minor capsid protein [Geobacillus subterraneus]BBW97226.1 hypothetical protein GsuE55_20590 [Geobacillus subterraneus]